MAVTRLDTAGGKVILAPGNRYCAWQLPCHRLSDRSFRVAERQIPSACGPVNHRLARQELHDLVWSEPDYKVAARTCISRYNLASRYQPTMANPFGPAAMKAMSIPSTYESSGRAPKRSIDNDVAPLRPKCGK